MGGNVTQGATPGIMLVRPSLHHDTPENRATFKRWTIVHFRDLLNLPALTPESKGIFRALRYTNTAGELLYTIHADNTNIWLSDAYKNSSRRLDLENTRTIEDGEEAVLQDGHGFGVEPMVWSICNAEFAILGSSDKDKARLASYHDFPLSLASPAGQRPCAPESLLVTLTYTASGVDQELPAQLASLQECVLAHVKSGVGDKMNGDVLTMVYRHLPDAQPDMHPTIAEGKDGNGSWVACTFVQADISDKQREALKADVSREAEKLKQEGKSDKWDVKIGVWKGEAFMS